MKVVELSNEVGKLLRGELADDFVLYKGAHQFVRLLGLELFAETGQLETLLLLLFALLLLTLLLLRLDARDDAHVFKLSFYAVINISLKLLSNLRHDFINDELFVVGLLRVFRLVSVRPYLIEVIVELVKLLNNLTGTDLNDLLLIVIIITLLALTLLFGFLLSLFLLALSLGLFLFGQPLGFLLFGAQRFFSLQAIVEFLDIFGRF